MRKLTWMVERKCEHDFDVIISHVCYISALFNGKFKPEKANPYQKKYERRSMTPEELKEANQMGLKALQQSIIGLYGTRLKKKN